MIHLRSISPKPSRGQAPHAFPFDLPVIKSLSRIDFAAPVTFFVGENGTGKSTLLEAVACAANLPAAGSADTRTDSTLGVVRDFGRRLRLSWERRTHRGFFLRAEDFFGYARRMAQMRGELEKDLKAVDEEYKGRSKMAVSLVKGALAGQIQGIDEKYGQGLDAGSHGENFLTLFRSRFVPGGLYLLDEPEAPLSPMRQLAFISMLKEMVEQESQFIICTHSPIIMAFPGAAILSFDCAPIRPVRYDEIEHVSIMKSFLANPERYLNRL